MPHFALSSGPSGPLIDVFVSVSIVRQAVLRKEGKHIPNPVNVKALVDTGASHSSIDISLVERLGLSPTGVVSVITPSTGADPCDQFTYDVGIFIPIASELPPWVFPFWTVSAAELQHQGFSMLYGRDLLAGSTLHYNGMNGLFTLTF